MPCLIGNVRTVFPWVKSHGSRRDIWYADVSGDIESLHLSKVYGKWMHVDLKYSGCVVLWGVIITPPTVLLVPQRSFAYPHILVFTLAFYLAPWEARCHFQIGRCEHRWPCWIWRYTAEQAAHWDTMHHLDALYQKLQSRRHNANNRSPRWVNLRCNALSQLLLLRSVPWKGHPCNTFLLLLQHHGKLCGIVVVQLNREGK